MTLLTFALIWLTNCITFGTHVQAATDYNYWNAVPKFFSWGFVFSPYGTNKAVINGTSFASDIGESLKDVIEESGFEWFTRSYSGFNVKNGDSISRFTVSLKSSQSSGNDLTSYQTLWQESNNLSSVYFSQQVTDIVTSDYGTSYHDTAVVFFAIYFGCTFDIDESTNSSSSNHDIEYIYCSTGDNYKNVELFTTSSFLYQTLVENDDTNSEAYQRGSDVTYDASTTAVRADGAFMFLFDINNDTLLDWCENTYYRNDLRDQFDDWLWPNSDGSSFVGTFEVSLCEYGYIPIEFQVEWSNTYKFWTDYENAQNYTFEYMFDKTIWQNKLDYLPKGFVFDITGMALTCDWWPCNLPLLYQDTYGIDASDSDSAFGRFDSSHVLCGANVFAFCLSTLYFFLE